MSDPYIEGKRGYQAGATKTQCPYPDTDSKATLWRAGWLDGQQTDKQYGETHLILLFIAVASVFAINTGYGLIAFTCLGFVAFVCILDSCTP